MSKYMRFTEDKTRFINQLPWKSEEEKQKVLDFFKSHANLESKIKSWQNRDKNATVQEIRDLISDTNTNSLEKEKSKEGYKGNIDWESHECRYIGEDENWIYITPLSYEGAKFCDSAECGGAGAKWCIGYEKTDEYWNSYINKGALFLMKFNKFPKNRKNDLKYMIEGYLGEDTVDIWNQKDNDKVYTLSDTEKEYLVQIKNLYEEILKKKIGSWFDNPEPGVYIAKNIEAFNHIEDIKKYLKVFKVKEGLDCSSITDAKRMFLGCKSLISIDASAFRNVTDASEMFYDCKSLISVDNPNFKNVTDASFMFFNCESLQSIDTPAFTKVTNASWMFKGCKSLKSIDASAFKNVTIANYMFYKCESLQSIDASVFKNVKESIWMFDDCTNLKTYIPSGNPEIDSKLDKLGAKSVQSLTESSTQKYWRDCLDGMMYF